MIRRLLIPVVVLAAIALTAVLALPSGGQAGEGPVRIELGDFTVRADRQEVRAGEVRFETRNVGAVEHELLVVRTDLAPDAIPRGLEGPAPELAGELVLGKSHAHHGTSGHDGTDGPEVTDGHPGADDTAEGHDAGSSAGHIAPGKTRRDTVRLAPGRYVLLCSLPGHYEAGQRTSLVVR